MTLLSYTLSDNTFRRWKDGPIDDEMRQLIGVVAEIVDAGIFYTSDVHAAVTARYALSCDELRRGCNRVEGGDWGMEIYYARSQLDRERADAHERETFARLALQPGQILGTIEVTCGYRMRRFRKVTVKSAEVGCVAVTGSAGGRSFGLTLSAAALARGIERARRQP